MDTPAEHELRLTAVKVLDRWPSAGLAIGVVRGGHPEFMVGQGVGDVSTKTPVTGDTVFRIASITKTFTAVAVMQLWERGLLDLDAPAEEYLRTFDLVPAEGVSSPTLRHLLTYTAGIGYWRRLSDVLHPGAGSGDTWKGPVPPLGDYYRAGLPVEVEPGSKWVYSNHGFAVLGQIVEDVTGEPIERFLRDRIFEPLAMDATDLGCPDRARHPCATGYALHSRGLRPVKHVDVPLLAAGSAFSTAADLSRYAAALLNGGTGERGTVLEPGTIALMFEPQHRPDRRLPVMGLGFLLGSETGHRTVGHDGILSGFLSAMSLAPDDDIGVVVLSNTGRLDGRGAAQPLAVALLRQLLGLPENALRSDVPQHPEVWAELCGWYGMEPGPVTNMFGRLLMGAGVEVRVHRGHLMLQPLTPLPPMCDGFRLHPDDPDDPYAFLVDFSPMGFATMRVVFGDGSARDGRMRLLMNGMSFEKRPDARNPRLWASGLLAGGATAIALRTVARHTAAAGR